MTSVLRAAAIAVMLMLSHSNVAWTHPPAIVGEGAERAISDEVLAFRKAMADAIAGRNAPRLQEMYAKSFVHQHASGNTAREARIASAIAGDAMVETAPAQEVSVRAPNDWVAIVTGTSALSSTTANAARTVKWIAVYTRSGNSWILAASQETVIATNKQ